VTLCQTYVAACEAASTIGTITPAAAAAAGTAQEASLVPVLQSSSHDDSLSSIVAHGAEVGSSRAPHLMGPIGNLVIW
jgi:hypothetical protein